MQNQAAPKVVEPKPVVAEKATGATKKPAPVTTANS